MHPESEINELKNDLYYARLKREELEAEIAELRRENDHKFAAMCRLRADIEKYRDYVRGLQAGTQFGV